MDKSNISLPPSLTLSTTILELLHEVLSDRPHSGSFALQLLAFNQQTQQQAYIDIHGHRGCQARQLNAANGNKRILHPVGV